MSFLVYKGDFSAFLDHESKYTEKIKSMVTKGQSRLIIDLNDLNQYDENLLHQYVIFLCNLSQCFPRVLRRRFLEEPMEYLPAWEDALKDFIVLSNFSPKV